MEAAATREGEGLHCHVREAPSGVDFEGVVREGQFCSDR